MSDLAIAPSSKQTGPQLRQAAEDEIQVEFVHDSRTVRSQWCQLESQLADVPWASRWDWTETWIKHYGDMVPYQFAVARRGGALEGICLVTEGVRQRRGPFPVRSLHVGTAGEPESDSLCVEYNSVLAPPEHADPFLESILRRAIESFPSDEFRLDGFAVDDLDATSRFDLPRVVRRRESPYFDLRAARENGVDPITCLGRSTRKKVRRNLRAFAGVTVEWAESAEEAHSIFQDMVDLHQARWNSAGQAGVYASRRFLGFHRDLIDKLVHKHQLILFRVRQEGRVVGCLQQFVDRNRVLCYQGGVAAGSDGTSPGLVTDYLCIQECIERGYDAYDFLAGDSLHKSRLSTASRTLAWAVLRRPNLKNRVLDSLSTLKSFTRPRSRC